MSGELERAMAMMELAHLAIHDQPQDFEDTLFVSMTERDTVLLGLSLACLWFMFPCLQDDSRDLQVRLLEIITEQKPDWVVDGPTE